MMRVIAYHVSLPVPLTDLCSDTGYSLVSLPGMGARAYLPPLASNTLLVPPDSLSCSARHRARYACGLANACALVYVAA